METRGNDLVCDAYLHEACGHGDACKLRHVEIEFNCGTCKQPVILDPLELPQKQGMYGTVIFKYYYCHSCQNKQELAIKITSHSTDDEKARNRKEHKTWSSLTDIPGVVPLLSYQVIGSSCVFIMPRMFALQSMRETPLTVSYKLGVIKRVLHVLIELSARGLCYPDGGCKQVLVDPVSKQAFLCDYEAVGNGNLAASLESMKILIWELRVEFKGHAEKLKNLEIYLSEPNSTLAGLESEISRL